MRRAAVVVFWAASDGADVAIPFLSDAEAGRAARYRSTEARLEFVAGAFIVRAVASCLLGVTMGHVVVDRSCPACSEEHGPPRVTAAPWLSVSVTHSSGQVGVAVAAGARVGLDIEQLGAPLQAALIRRVCSVPERKQLAAARPATASADFARIWCRKESLLKAYGVGLSVPPAAVDVSGSRPVMRGDSSLGFDLGACAGWLPMAGPGESFAAALFATDNADLVAEVQIAQLSTPVWDSQYSTLLNGLHPGR